MPNFSLYLPDETYMHLKGAGFGCGIGPHKLAAMLVKEAVDAPGAVPVSLDELGNPSATLSESAATVAHVLRTFREGTTDQLAQALNIPTVRAHLHLLALANFGFARTEGKKGDPIGSRLWFPTDHP